MKLAELGELGLLAELARRGLVHGIDDDAARLADGLVITQDALVEGVHFRLDWLSWRELGWRAAAVNLSDLAASGADPEGLVVTLALPPDTDVADVLELYEGIAETGVRVIGGDTTIAEVVVLSVTAAGRSERVPGRAGAQPGYVRPPLRLLEGKELGAVANALLDISDGLAVDAGHISSRSGCRVAIELERVPLAAGAELQDLAFGEDYELLAAVAGASPYARIGRCEEGEGVAFTLNGEPYELGGWEHFR
jgi:thiamine-monophosphate kinase